MKSIIKLAICSIALVSSIGTYAHDTTVNKSNGGKNGWDKVTENHTVDHDNLTCKDPGDNACVWNGSHGCDVINTAQGPISITNTIEPTVEHQLDNGVLSGSMQYSPYIVTWTGQNSGNYTLTVSN